MKINKNIVYIDESNILSKIGNSAYVCLYIQFLNKDIIAQKIVDIEKQLKISHTHWVDMPWKLRVKFAERIKILDFICKIVVYRNPIIQENILTSFLPKVIEVEDNICKIIIDGNKGKDYELKLKRLLKNKGLKFERIIFMNDKSEPGIRLADFLAGMYRSYLDNKNDYNTYMYNLLKHKIKILS